MSRIISPHGPTQIVISFNEETGLTECRIVDALGRTRDLPVYQVCAIFAQLILKFLQDSARRGAFGADTGPEASNNGGNAGQNAGEAQDGKHGKSN